MQTGHFLAKRTEASGATQNAVLSSVFRGQQDGREADLHFGTLGRAGIAAGAANKSLPIVAGA
jgi:hypothetical protein